jgi:hypothetical protein
MPREKSKPARFGEGPASASPTPRTFEDRVGEAVRGLYPDDSVRAYGPIGNQPWPRGTDQQRGENYLYHQRNQARRYHHEYMDRVIEGMIGDPQEANMVRYMGPGNRLAHDLYDDMGEFVDDHFSASAVYGRRAGLNPAFQDVPPTYPRVDSGPREVRPKRDDD